MTQAIELMTPAEAARVLGLTVAAVKSHDRELSPYRTTTGRRLYLRSTVLAFAATRDVRAGERDAKRARGQHTKKATPK